MRMINDKPYTLPCQQPLETRLLVRHEYRMKCWYVVLVRGSAGGSVIGQSIQHIKKLAVSLVLRASHFLHFTFFNTETTTSNKSLRDSGRGIEVCVDGCCLLKLHGLLFTNSYLLIFLPPFFYLWAYSQRHVIAHSFSCR